MIKASDVLTYHQSRPFEPFDIRTSDGRVAGMLMLTLEWSDWRNGEIWWIQSVYVHRDFRRLGVFKAIYRHVESLARQQNAVGLRLYVVHENKAAQETYRQLGMELSEYLVMENLKLRGS